MMTTKYPTSLYADWSNTMTVYVLLVGYEYEGCECLGVYMTEAEASAAFELVDTGGYCVIEERVIGAAAQVQY
jgi:hypothetical protein